MKKIKDGIRSFLIVLTAASVLMMSSCGVVSVIKPPSDTEETKAPEETTAPADLNVYTPDYAGNIDRYLKDLSGAKYNGAAARIVTVKKNLVVPDENMGKVLSEDLAERNAGIESTLGLSISAEERDADSMYKEIRSAVMSGDYYADAIIYPQDMIGTFVTGGAVINMKGLPGFETDMGYYYPSSVAAGTGGDAVYAVAGPASLDPESLSCVYFNKDIIEKCGLESPYALADRGEWTIDKYIEYANAAGALEGEYFGYGAQNTAPYLSDLFFFGAGETLTKSSFGSYPTLSLGGERTVSVIEKIRGATVSAESSGNSLAAIENFAKGNTLFLIDRLATMRSIANMGTQWGILPIPKYDKDQGSYLSLAYYEDALFFGVVSTATNYAMTADLIACMNIMSYGYTQDAYVTNASYYYLRDNESIRMLSTVVHNPVFDFSYSFASTYISIPSATFMAVRNTVSGVSTLERYINMWSGQFNNSMYYLFDIEE